MEVRKVNTDQKHWKISNICFYIVATIIAAFLIFPILSYAADLVTARTAKYDLNSAESVVIPDGISELSSNDNYNEFTKNMYIPDTISKIPSNFFDRFTDLENIYYGGTWEEWGELLGSNQPSNVTVYFDVSENNLNII